MMQHFFFCEDTNIQFKEIQWKFDSLCNFINWSKNKFEKCRAICASVGGMGGVVAWVRC